MAIEFKLEERFLGWALHSGTPTEMLAVRNAALLSPDNAQEVQDVLERLQNALLHKIPNLPQPSQIDNLLIIIKHDLSGLAYVNRPSETARVRVTRAVAAGQPVMRDDIASIEDVALDIEVPDDAAVIVIRSAGWRRSVYFDLGPIADKPTPRTAPLSRVLAQQLTFLWGLQRVAPTPTRTRVDRMADGFQRLRNLLEEKNETESSYQELLEDHPWMLGVGTYSKLQRHGRFDDKHIPDFTGRRASDDTDDIIELKQPFLTYFRRDNDFAADFHAAWSQAERYLVFARDNRDYLRREKGMRLDTPKCLLIAGTSWTEEQSKGVRIKELGNPNIRVMTYDQLLAQARLILSVMRTAQLDERVGNDVDDCVGPETVPQRTDESV